MLNKLEEHDVDLNIDQCDRCYYNELVGYCPNCGDKYCEECIEDHLRICLNEDKEQDND